jgi:large subunit ribosomal protein L22
MKATLSNYRQSPRKVRLVADSMRGKSVVEAETNLAFMIKRAAPQLGKLLSSAVANALNSNSVKKEDLVIKEISVDKGIVMKRSMPRAFGRASRINKRSSHITIVLGLKEEKVDKKAKKVEVKEEAVKEVKKAKVTKPRAKKADK